jgi:purine catabolism regulator
MTSSISPTLRDLLRLSFSEPVAWLTAEAGAGRPVQWVAVSAAELRPGDLLLLPPDSLDGAALAQASGRQAAGVLVLGEASLPEGVSCEGLSVAAVPGYTGDVRAAQKLLLTILINQRAALMERGVRIHAQLSQLEAEGGGLGGLVKAMSNISGRGVLVQDKRGRILAEHPSSALVTIWKDVLDQVNGLESLPEALVDRKRAGVRAGAMIQEIPGGLARLVAPIVVGEVARGYLSMIGLSGELDALDHQVAEQGLLVCAIEMARNKAVREAEKRLKGDLLTALLRENLSPRDARLWAHSMDLDLHQAYVALRFAWDGPSPPSRRRLETLVNGEVTRHGLRVIVSPMGVEVVCFCEAPPGAGHPDLALDFAQAVLDQGRREYPDVPGRCGVGAPALDLADWRASFRQAGQALEMARRLGETKPLYYSDLSVYRLLFQIEHSPELIAFQEETLGPLLAHEGASELIHTLETYFSHNGNLSQTAEALFIHRNTLIYRMERIASITGMDLDNPENRLAIQLALRIYRMVGTKPG